MSDFIVELMPNKTHEDIDSLMVKQQSTGWFYPNLSRIMAEELCKKLNELLEKGNDRFYLDDEHVMDKKHIMKPIWVENYTDAIELKDFLNDNIRGC